MPSPVAPPAASSALDPGVDAWSRRIRLLDLGALVLSLLSAAIETSVLLQRGGAVGDWLGLALVLSGIAVLRLRHLLRPLQLRLWSGTALVALGPLAATAFGGDPLVIWTIVVFTAFSITLRGLPGAAVGAILGAAAYVAVIGSEDFVATNSTAFVALACSFTAAATGSALRSYVRYRSEAAERTHQALVSRDAETHQRVAEERVRIARDLHDIVGHEIAVLNIHLSVAQVNLPAEATAARASLESARTSVQAVLSETQRILHILRTERGEEQPGAPAAEFSRIPGLVESFRQAGADVRSQLCPDPERLDPEVSTAAYRIVEEALTNAQKHGAGSTVVTTTITGRDLVLSIANPKRPGTVSSGRRGYGLIGMRERVASAGGRLVLHDDDRAFAVEAILRTDGSTYA